MGKRAPLKEAPTHWTLKPAGGNKYKGTYFRRLEDIQRGLRVIDASRMPSGGRFLFLYYGCEKLGKGIVGIHKTWAADDAYDQSLHLSELRLAVCGLRLDISDAELNALFVSNDKTTARYWRNEIVHNFGPWNVKTIIKHSATLNKQMHDFLESHTSSVLDFLKRTYGHLLP